MTSGQASGGGSKRLQAQTFSHLYKVDVTDRHQLDGQSLLESELLGSKAFVMLTREGWMDPAMSIEGIKEKVTCFDLDFNLDLF